MFKFGYVALPATVLLTSLAFLCSNATSAAAARGASAWVLQKGQDMPRPPRRPTLRIQGSKLSGSTGCNNFTATLNQRPDKRVAITQVSLTRMLCEGVQNSVETAFVRALGLAQFLNRQGKMLTFLSAERAPLLVWEMRGKSSSARSGRRKAHKKAHIRAHMRRSSRRAACWY